MLRIKKIIPGKNDNFPDTVVVDWGGMEYRAARETHEKSLEAIKNYLESGLMEVFIFIDKAGHVIEWMEKSGEKNILSTYLGSLIEHDGYENEAFNNYKCKDEYLAIMFSEFEKFKTSTLFKAVLPAVEINSMLDSTFEDWKSYLYSFSFDEVIGMDLYRDDLNKHIPFLKISSQSTFIYDGRINSEEDFYVALNKVEQLSEGISVCSIGFSDVDDNETDKLH